MANKGWFDPQLVSEDEWFDPQFLALGWFADGLTDSTFGAATQAGFLSRPVGGLRRMGATSGGGPVVSRAYYLPLLGVA